jgi:hypothetical protein
MMNYILMQYIFIYTQTNKIRWDEISEEFLALQTMLKHQL